MAVNMHALYILCTGMQLYYSRILRVIHQVALFEMPLMEPTEVKNMKGINGNMVSKTDISWLMKWWKQQTTKPQAHNNEGYRVIGILHNHWFLIEEVSI